MNGTGLAFHAGGTCSISKLDMLFFLSNYFHKDKVTDDCCDNDDKAI